MRLLKCLALLSLASLAACSTPPASKAEKLCVPGQEASKKCHCPGGLEGYQYCNDLGSGYEECDCSGAPSVPDVVAPQEDVTSPPEDTTPPAGDTSSCVAHFSKACVGSEAFWYDSCGKKGELAKTCLGGETCVGGECVTGCQPKAKKGCNGNNVFWFDSCGKPGGAADICTEEQFCKDGNPPTCVKPFYNGTWLVTADPDQKAIPGGLGNAYFPPTNLELVIDGTKASGDIKAFDPPVHYDGTLDGKVLKMEANFTDNGTFPTTHHEVFIVTFSTATEFSGTDSDDLIVDLGMGPSPLGKLVWEVTGKKQ